MRFPPRIGVYWKHDVANEFDLQAIHEHQIDHVPPVTGTTRVAIYVLKDVVEVECERKVSRRPVKNEEDT